MQRRPALPTTAQAPRALERVTRSGSDRVGVPAETLPAALRHYATTRPDAVAYYVCQQGHIDVLTWRSLLQAAERFAAGLQARSIAPGQVVMLCLDTSAELLVAFYGCQLAGVVPNIGELPFGRAAVAAWLDKISARAALLGCSTVIVDPLAHALLDGAPGLQAFEPGAITASDASFVEVPIDAASMAFAQFTSGTQSTGRAVMLSHRQVIANLRSMGERAELRRDDLFVSWLPLFHDLGLVANVLFGFAHGLPVALLPPLRFLFGPEQWLWAIHHFRGTRTFAPNFAYEMCIGRIGDAEIAGLDLSSLRSAHNCAEFIHATTVRRFTERFVAYGFDPAAQQPAYGMAELVVGASSLPPGRPLRIDRIDRNALLGEGRAVPVGEHEDGLEIVSCGPMMPGYTVEIVDADGRELPERHQGRIMIQGPSVFDGYINDPEGTADALRDGWLWTGDLGYVVGDELYVCGRHKDLIIRGGENIHPYPLERAAAEVAGIRPGGVAALGVADLDTGTESIVIVAETKRDDPADRRVLAEAVRSHVQTRTGVSVDRVVLVSPRAIPKTTSGKTRRAEVLRMLPTWTAEAPLPRAAS